MPPDDNGTAGAWLRYARSDFAAAASPPVPEVLPAVYCFHAQQAAEKAVKAVYVSHGVEFAYIHDIRQLLDDAPVVVPESVYEAAMLTAYAVITRYPGELAHLTGQHVADAIDAARAVLDWAQRYADGDGRDEVEGNLA